MASYEGTDMQVEAKDGRTGVVHAVSSMDEALDYLAKHVQILTERLEGVLRPDEDVPVSGEKLTSIRTRSPLAYDIEHKVSRVQEIATRLAAVTSRVDL